MFYIDVHTSFATLFMGIHKEHTVAWEKFSMKKFSSEARCDKTKTQEIFLPQINRAVYNDL